MDWLSGTIYPSGVEITILLENLVNTMVDEPLAPYITRSSATISLIMQDKHASFLKEEGFQHAILVLRNYFGMGSVNTLRLRQNDRHSPDYIFKANISMKMVVFWSKFVPYGPIENISSLVQIMTSHYLNQWQPSLMTRICITLPRWVNR